MSDQYIYNTDEYKARMERAQRSLESLINQAGYTEAISTAAESIAYWQMRTVIAESMLYDIGHIDLAVKSRDL